MSSTARKQSLRDEMIARRQAITPKQARAASERAHAALRGVADYKEARIVALYAAMASHNELDTSAIAQELRTRGAMVVYPRVVGRGKPLRFHLVADESAMIPLRMGLLQPAADAPEVPAGSIDLILVPGIAFDRTGHRLGFGAGYYDLTLAHSPRARRIGYCHDFQIVPVVPSTETDVRVDTIVTETGALTTGARANIQPRSER